MEDAVLLYRAPSAMEAALLAQRLEAEGIACEQVGGQSRLAFGDLPMDSLLVDLWVARADAGRAKDVIEAYYADGGPGSRSSGTAWTCPACGAEGEAGFDRCWSCGAERAAV